MASKTMKGYVLADGQIRGTKHYLPRGWQKYLHKQIEYELADIPTGLTRPGGKYAKKARYKAKLIRVVGNRIDG